MVHVGQKRRRGDFLETLIHDTTRVSNPHTASIFEKDGVFRVVPDNHLRPVLDFDTISGAVGYVERFIKDEHRK